MVIEFLQEAFANPTTKNSIDFFLLREKENYKRDALQKHDTNLHTELLHVNVHTHTQTYKCLIF